MLTKNFVSKSRFRRFPIHKRDESLWYLLKGIGKWRKSFANIVWWKRFSNIFNRIGCKKMLCARSENNEKFVHVLCSFPPYLMSLFSRETFANTTHFLYSHKASLIAMVAAPNSSALSHRTQGLYLRVKHSQTLLAFFIPLFIWAFLTTMMPARVGDIL